MSKRNHLSFFKILVGDHVFTKLKVPPAFLNNLKRINFPTVSTISLKSDPKLSWKVKMEIMECGGVYFTKGWEKLCKDNKLEIGDFLVFYLVVLDKDASFQLIAFDQTCCDKMRLSSTSPLLDKNKGIKSDDDDDDDDDDEDDDDDPTSKKSKQNASSSGKIVSKYPSFQKVITRTGLNCMRLPRSFAKSYLNGDCMKQILIFETSCGQSWPVTLRDNTLLCSGLSQFLNDNFVKVGNMCTFFLADSNQMLFRVYINRGIHDQIPQSAEKLDFSNVIPPRSGSGFASEYPFFQLDITEDLFYRKRLTIPWAFAKNNMNTELKSQTVTLQSGGRLWPVKLAIPSHPKQARLYGGITAFIKENNIKVGDILTFELVNKINMVFRVSIYKG